MEKHLRDMTLAELTREEGIPCSCGRVHKCGLRYFRAGQGAVKCLPEALADVMAEIDAANRLAAEAAAGDAGALRECVETDPALAGLDRLYCQDVVRALMELHADMLDDGTDEGNKRGESICF